MPGSKECTEVGCAATTNKCKRKRRDGQVGCGQQLCAAHCSCAKARQLVNPPRALLAERMPKHSAPAPAPNTVAQVPGPVSVVASPPGPVAGVPAPVPSTTPLLITTPAAVSVGAAAVRVRATDVARLKITPRCLYERQDRMARLNDVLVMGDRKLEPNWKYAEAYPACLTWRQALDPPASTLTQWWFRFKGKAGLGSAQLDRFISWAEVQFEGRRALGNQAPATPTPLATTPPTTQAADMSCCCVCRDKPAEIVFDPCGHLCLCSGCVGSVVLHGHDTCPVCRSAYSQYIRVYR